MMSTQNTPPAFGPPSAADTTQEPSNLVSESQAASSLTTEALATTTDPSTIADIAQHGMLLANVAANTTTTVSSDAPACANPRNFSPIPQQQDFLELTELVGALRLRSLDQPATPSSGRDSGYEADGERKLGWSRSSKRQTSRQTLRKRQRRRQLGETVVRRPRSSSPSMWSRTSALETRQCQNRQAWRRSL